MPSTSTSNLTIIPTFDSSITSLANAATIEATINTAIAALENDVTANAPVTVSIDFKNITTGLANSLTPQSDISYSTYLAALQADPNKSANDATALATMPAGPNTGINNDTDVLLTGADLAALGQTAAASALVSGNGGFDSVLSFNFGIINDSRTNADPNRYDLQATATHEIDEILGIGGNGSSLYQAGVTPPASLPSDVSGLDFFRYSAPGVRSFTYDPTQSAYFSIDGGVTKLVNFNQQNGANGPDFGDWGNPQGTGSGNTPANVQDAFGTPGGAANLGRNELTALDVVGWTLTPAGMIADGLSSPVPSVIGGTQAGQATTDEAAVKPFAAVTLTDSNAGAPTETVTVTPSKTANGTLSDPNAATDGSTLSGGVLTVTGSAAQVQADLRALVFTPTAHEATPGTQVTTAFTISDTNSASQTTTNSTASVVATAKDDAPTIAGAKAGQTTSGTKAVNPFAGVAVTDPDAGTQDSLTITLTGAGGTATDADGLLSGTGLTKTGTGTYTLAATGPASLSSELDALTFSPVETGVAAGGTVTTDFVLAASQTAGGSTATATNSTVTVVAAAVQNIINGPAGGWAVLNGTSGADVITAHGWANAIFGHGGADIINAGDGGAYVDVAGGGATVTLGGSWNAVVGGDGTVTVKGAPDGYTGVTLGNGNDTVQVGGQHDIILLGNGTNLVSGTQGMAFITTGSGNDTIKLGGSGSTVNAGTGTNSITGGTGQDTFVMPKAGQGFDGITGFTETNGDVLDLRAALAATSWNGKAATLSNYLKVTDGGGSATLLVAPSGSGGGTAVATLNGSGNLGLADLLSHHSLLTS